MRLQLLKKNLPAFIALTLSCSGIIPASASSIAGANNVKVVNKFAAADSVVECATIKDALDKDNGTVVRLALNHAYVLFQKTIPTSNGREVVFLLNDNSGVITVSNIALDGNNLKLQGKELSGTLVAQISFDGNIHKLVESANTYPVNLEVKEGTAPKPESKNLSELSDADIAKLVTVSGTLTTEGDLFDTKYFLQKGTDRVQLVDKMQIGSDWDSAFGAELSFTGVVLDGEGKLELMPLEAPTVQYSYDENGGNLFNTTSEKRDVVVKRTFLKDTWNTLCVPFNLNIGQLVQTFGRDVKVYKFSGKVNGTAVNFTEEDSLVEAGKPYIVVPAKQVTNPVFNDVTISVTEPGQISTEDGNYAFIGVFNPVTLNINDPTNLIFNNGKLYYPATSQAAYVKGFRAYFYVPGNASTKTMMVAIDGQTTSISKLNAGEVETNAPVYNLNGQLVGNGSAKLAKGIYIQSGKKFIVK